MIENDLNKQNSMTFHFWQWTGFADKQLWDWLVLLIIPAMLGFGVFYFEQQASKRQQESAIDQARQQSLSNYLEQMVTLMVDKHLLDPANKLTDARKLIKTAAIVAAKSLTGSVVKTLDSRRNAQIIRFLSDAKLISVISEANVFQDIDLKGANLSHLHLDGIDLSGSDLSNATLAGASLSGATLLKADLSGTFLYFTGLDKANLIGTNFQNAIALETAFLEGIKYKERSSTCAAYTDRYPDEDCKTIFPAGFVLILKDRPPSRE